MAENTQFITGQPESVLSPQLDPQTDTVLTQKINRVISPKHFMLDSGNSLTINLISYWKEEDSTDFYGVNNLLDVASPTYVWGKVSNGVKLVAASTQYQEGGDVATFNFSSAHSWSISLWAKRATTGAAVVLMGKTNSAGSGWYFLITAANKISLILREEAAGTSLSVQGGTNLTSTTQFYHLVMTYNGNQAPTGIKFYVNGLLETNTTNDNTLGAASISNNGSFRIGQNAFPNAPFNGVIDEAAIWKNKVLTQTEIFDLYNQGEGQTMVS